MQCEVRVLFGSLGLDSGFLQKQRKGELSWIPVPAQPPLLAAARQPLPAQCARSSLRASTARRRLSISPVRATDTETPAESSLSPKNAPSVFLALSPAPTMLSLSRPYFTFSHMIDLLIILQEGERRAS